MSIGSMAKNMLGFADDFLEGASKGVGDAGKIRTSVNKISSNMTKGQKKALKAFGSSAGDSAKQVAKSQAYHKSTKASAVNGFKQIGRDDLANKVANAKGMPLAPGAKSNLKNITGRVSGIQNPTFGNKLGDAMIGGFRDTYSGLKAKQGVSQSLAAGFMDGDKVRMDRVAGGFVTASAAARIATGGGLYKDRNGSTNIIGVPFI
jgi:hypothetical protein